MITDVKPKKRAFLIENNNQVVEVEVVSERDGMSIVKLLCSNGGFRIRNNRLYNTQCEAEEVIKKLSQKRVVHNASKPLPISHSIPFMHPHSLGW